nr:type II toxin-antitoxin system VapC family toxin [Bacteroidota bacterium]
MICLDTSVLIDFFRKKDKTKSFFHALAGEYDLFAVSAITEYEVYVGSNIEQDKYWDDFFKRVIVLPYDSQVNKIAIEIFRKLKHNNKLIDAPDLFIAASAIANNMQLATLNDKHFSRVHGLT